MSMKRFSIAVIGIALAFFFAGCVAHDNSSLEAGRDENEIAEHVITDELVEVDESFIEEAVEYMCSQQLYTDRDVYDSGHMLLMPMKYGFAKSNENIINSFRSMFTRFVFDDGAGKSHFDEMTGLNQNHWLYLMSEYMVFCVDYGYELDREIFDTVVEYMVKYNEKYIGNFGGEAVYASFQDLMQGLLHGDGYIRSDSKNNLLSDNDTFPLAIICDCLYVMQQEKYECQYSGFLEWGGRCAEDMMASEADWITEDRWVLQIGGWRDQQDYRYAGYDSVEAVIPEKDMLVDGIGCDSSHYRRIAAFLCSFERVCENEELFEALKTGLANQLIQVMFERDPTSGYWVIRNYMDGSNGVFRYDAETKTGYGPYQMSTSVLDGWWSQLGDARIAGIYKDIYGKLRYENELPTVYIDPVTTRDRNPFYTCINNYKMMVYIASLGL